MSKRELKSLNAANSTETVDKRLRLRSGTVLQFLPPDLQQSEVMQMDDDETTTQVIELQQKLVLVEQAVNEKDLKLQEAVSKLEEVEEKASELELELANGEAIAELQKAKEALDQAKGKFNIERRELVECLEELEKSLEERSECANCELEGQGMRLELRELETIQQKFDCEREQHRLERERDAAVIAELKRSLESKEGLLSKEKPAGEGGDGLTDSGGESSSAKMGDFGERGVSSKPTDKAAGPGDGSHSSKESDFQ